MAAAEPAAIAASGDESLSERPPRLLFLMNEALFFTTHRMPVALAAREAGFDIHVAAPYERDYVAAIERAGFPYHPIPLRRGGRGLIGEARLALSFWRLVGRLAPDLVHHVAMKPVLYGGAVARLRRVPAAVHAITGLGHLFIREDAAARLQQRLVMVLFRFALGHRHARAIFQNGDDLDLFVREGLVDPARAVMIRGSGVDMEAFAATPEPDGEAVVMFPSRLLGDKGVREFVAAARALKEQGVRARFVLVGRTDPANPTDVGEPVVRAWEAEGAIEWWGYRTDMAAVLAMAHVVCMPSYREGLPRVLIEAAACARPIVTADVPGCREIVRHEVNGLLVPPRDAPATAAAIRRLLEDEGLRREMGRRARDMAVAEFAVDAFVAKTLAVYRSLLPAAALALPANPD